tara:strand:+ start:57803 stop:58186 length:384 start_codon:yes stop_codon:yes gene_type:complete
MISEEEALYKENILDHYRNPRNKGVLINPTHQRSAKNPLCGDQLTLFMNVDNDCIKKIAFQGRGCAISQASMSLLTEHLQGKTIHEAMQLTVDNIKDLLGISVSFARQKCANLSLQTLHGALGGHNA